MIQTDPIASSGEGRGRESLAVRRPEDGPVANLRCAGAIQRARFDALAVRPDQLHIRAHGSAAWFDVRNHVVA